MLGFDKNRPGSFLLDTLMPARGSLPTAPGSAASPCELVFQTDNDSTLGRSHIIPALGWQLDRPVLPCHSGNLLSLYEAGHPATQARLLPTNTLWGVTREGTLGTGFAHPTRPHPHRLLDQQGALECLRRSASISRPL